MVLRNNTYMVKVDIIKLIHKIQNREDKNDIEFMKWIKQVEQYTGTDELYYLIFHHKPELTPEEIYEKAMSYKPLITPPPTRKE